ncbi:hypothetical protein [Pseudomonas reactans]
MSISIDTLCHFRVVRGLSKVGEDVEIAYVGVSEGLVYIEPFIEGCYFELSSIVSQGTFEWKDLERFLRNTKSELVVMMAPVPTISQFLCKTDVVGVCRIHQEVDVSRGYDHIKSQISRREEKRRTQCIAQGFYYNVSVEDRDFYEFYHSMHLPTMRNRYGDLARSVKETEAYTDLFKKGVLFRVYRTQEWVAGSVSQIDESSRILNARLIGVKEGCDMYRTDGSQGFVYHSIIEWAADNSNIDCVDFQGCEPFLTKGTFQYKKRFGARAVIPNNKFGDWRLLIRVASLSLSARHFLINNPFLVEDKRGGLNAQYCFDATSGPRKDIPYASEGINGAVYLNLDSLYD